MRKVQACELAVPHLGGGIICTRGGLGRFKRAEMLKFGALTYPGDPFPPRYINTAKPWPAGAPIRNILRNCTKPKILAAVVQRISICVIDRLSALCSHNFTVQPKHFVSLAARLSGRPDLDATHRVPSIAALECLPSEQVEFVEILGVDQGDQSLRQRDFSSAFLLARRKLHGVPTK